MPVLPEKPKNGEARGRGKPFPGAIRQKLAKSIPANPTL
jgi:hypothetical protein